MSLGTLRSISKRTKFTQREAQEIAQAHLGMRGFARHRAGHCEVGILRAIGDPYVLGKGPSFRRAFEDAGVWFNVR
jgi:hypothetical protein